MVERKEQPASLSSDAEALLQVAQSQRGMEAAQTLARAAELLRRKGEVEPAFFAYERALAELADQIGSPTAAKLGAALEFELGKLCEEDLGRFEQALLHYQQAFKLRPDYLEPLRRGRLIYQSLGDMDMVARLIELHLANLVAGEAQQGVDLALELGQLKLRLHDPAGAVEVLRSALRMHNEATEDTEVPEALLATLAEAYMSPDYQPGISEKEHARRNASDIFLGLAKRYLDDELLSILEQLRAAEEEEGTTSPLSVEQLLHSKDKPLTEQDKKALGFFKRALEADIRNVTAAVLLEAMYLRAPESLGTPELVKLYRSGARVTRRGPKLLKLYEQSGSPDYLSVADACRAGLDAVSSMDEWRETRQVLVDVLKKAGDQLGLGQLREEDALEAALPEERAELMMEAADYYNRGGDTERYIACLKQAFHELPLHSEAFRKLSDYYKSRRDFIGLAVIQENRMAAQFETARLDLQSYAKQLEELGELYEKKLQDVVSAAAIWRRIDELLPSLRSQSERKRLGQRLSRTEMQISELAVELERMEPDDLTRVEYLRRLAQLYREIHEPKHATTVLEQLLDLAPGDLGSIKVLIELAEQSGDTAKQLELLRQQAGIAHDKAERLGILRRMMTLCDQRLLRRDDQFEGQDSIEMMVWVCRSLLTELPSDRDALKRLADALHLVGSKNELLEVLESYLKVAPTPREKLTLHRRIAKIGEDCGDLARSVSHLERAVRICPPGPEAEEVLCELSRIYGAQGRMELAVSTLELVQKQSSRSGPELHRLLGRLTLQADDPQLLDKSLRAFREVLVRLPQDTEALAALQKIHRTRGEWKELEQVLRRQLQPTDPPLPPRERLTLALDLAEVLGQHLGSPKQAAELLEAVQAETPIVDLRVHRHLRGLYEELGDVQAAVACEERELLLTEDPVARVERAIEIARLWQTRKKDNGRAYLSYDRAVRLAPELPEGTPERAAVRRLITQALEAMSQMSAQRGKWDDVVAIGQKRLNLAVEQDEAMQAAAILVELAQVYEEKLSQPQDGFGLRMQAFELAPDLMSLDQLAEIAHKYGQWKPLADLHTQRVERALTAKLEVPLESVLAASSILEQKLGDPIAAFRLLKRSLPVSVSAAISATDGASPQGRLLREMDRVVRTVHKKGSEHSTELALESVSLARELTQLYRSLVDEVVRMSDAGIEETALRVHRLLGESAKVREQVLFDPAGALGDRLHAFAVGGERDHSEDPIADEVFATTVVEIHRLALLSGQIKEAVSVDTRRLERAQTELRRQQVSSESAGWLDDYGSDPPRALKACLKALSLASDGSDAQAELRGRLFRLGQKMGLLAWDEIARAERAMVQSQPKLLRQRLLYLASLWQQGAADSVRAVDAAGQALRMTYFPSGVPTSGKAAQPLSELLVPQLTAELVAEQAHIRTVLDGLLRAAQGETEPAAKLVTMLDNLANQLTEAGATAWAARVLIDAAQADEKRARLGQAERRYQEALKQGEVADEAMTGLERIYRQQRRLADLAALLEKRRPQLAESAQLKLLVELAEVYREINKYQPALNALQQAVAIDDSDAGPYLSMAKLFEVQKTFTRATESYKAAAQRSTSAVEAARALLQAAELLERKQNESDEALSLSLTALRKLLGEQGARLARGETPAVPESLREQRDAAWNNVERLLGKLQRQAEIYDLLDERLQVTPIELAQEREALLQRQYELHKQQPQSESTPRDDHAEPGEPSQAPSDRLLGLLVELSRLRPTDDALLHEQQQLLLSRSELAKARAIAEQRRVLAEQQGAEPAILAERFLAVARLDLELGSFAAAEAALEQVLTRAPSSADALRTLVDLHQRTANHSGLVAALVRLSSQQTDLEAAVGSLKQAAQVTLATQDDTEAAEKLLGEALQRVDAAPAVTPAQKELVRRALGQVLVPLFELARQKGRTEEAQALAQRAIREAELIGNRAAELQVHLGQEALAAGKTDEAIGFFDAALTASPGLLEPTLALLELLGPSGNHARIDQLIEATLSTVAAGESILPEVERARLRRRQAAARQELGLVDGTLAALKEAEQLVPGTLAEKLWLGETAFAQGDFATALLHLAPLSSLMVDRDALPEPLTQARLADLLDQAGQAAQALGKLDEARTLWQAVLTLVGDHAAATNHYLDLLLAAGQSADAEEALAMLSGRASQAAAAGDVQAARRDYRRAAALAAGPIADSLRAQDFLKQALALLPPLGEDSDGALRDEWSTLLAQVYENAEQLGELSDARGYAERLAQLAETVKGQSVWLSRAAQCALRCGDGTGAKTLLLQALSGTPAQLSLIGDYLEQATDEEAHEKLPGLLQAAMATATSATTPRGPEWQAQLQGLWVRAATIHSRMGDGPLAAQAYERALTVLADQTGSEALGLRRAVLEVLPDTEHDRARGHLHALLAASPRDVVLLGKLQAVEERAHNKGAASRLSQLLHLLDPSLPAPPAPTLPPKDAKLDEADHARLADPESRAMADILSALFDGVYSLKAPTLDSLGVQGTDRLQGSETSPDELARAFALSSRVLGNQRAGLYRPVGHTLPLPRIMAKLPTAVIASPQLGKRPIGELLFLVARAVEGLRPEFIMPMAMPADDLTRLIALAVRAFSPKQTQKPADDVATWKRELAYRASKRLQELLKDQAELDATSQSYRVAIRRALQRAALLVSGDLLAARSVLLTVDVPAAQDPGSAQAGLYLRLGEGDVSAQEEAEADLADLCAFFIAPQNAALFDRLHPKAT
ncbi:MAG: hypothetical protein JNM83_02435 [Myxococcales bacterium]|nr:hypothetical protein [Myxococcales bacterium]